MQLEWMRPVFGVRVLVLDQSATRTALTMPIVIIENVRSLSERIDIFLFSSIKKSARVRNRRGCFGSSRMPGVSGL